MSFLNSKSKKGQITIREGPALVLIVGFIFIMMATIAFVASEYGEAIHKSNNYENDSAFNVTEDLASELLDNTSMVGMVLTIGLVGIILGLLIGIFAGASRRGV